jgi:hypothetical protein
MKIKCCCIRVICHDLCIVVICREINKFNNRRKNNDTPIYIAIINNNIVVFAGYNTSKKRKEYFGVLEILRTCREKKLYNHY